jgi:molybdopterin converting factor small subunit
LSGDRLHSYGGAELRVHVSVYGALRELVDETEMELELPESASVADAIKAAGLEDRVDLWVLVDGQRAGRDGRLQEGSKLAFFQPSGGG